MRTKKMLGAGIMVILLMVAGNLAAQPVWYDGTIGDADPTSQGWNLMTFGSASATPDPVNDLVSIVVGTTTGIDTANYSLPTNHTMLQYAVMDDYYTMEFGAGFSDIGHDFAELDLITGLNSGSAGYRDRFFFYDYQVRFIGMTPTGNWGADARPAAGTAWTDMSVKNLYRWERNGTGVSFYANDELFWEGTGGSSSIGSTQLGIRDNANNAINMDWYSLSVENLNGTPTSYVIYDGTVDNASPANQNISFSGTQTVTVNDADDNIRIESSGEMWADLGGTNVPQLAVITGDDSYYWEATLAVNDAIDQIYDARLYTGTETGSAGYTDKVDFEDDRVRVFYLTADDDSPDADGIIERDMSVKTTYRYERQGDAVKFFIDDILAFSGTGGSDNSGALNWFMYDWVGDLDIELYDYRFGEIPEVVLLAGDANRDGQVSAGDYASVQANFGNTGEIGIPGDANLDGQVSAGDYASVQANFGNTLAEGVVPEPATIIVMGCGAIGLLRRRRRV